MMATLEHANFTVSDPKVSAAWMQRVFGWKTRWEGPSIAGGYTVHVGSAHTYLALYAPGNPQPSGENSYDIVGGLNHVGVLVDDIDETEKKVVKAGFTPKSHADYEPGKRFYFDDDNGIEFEVISYD
ncbi:VOC family protein [Ruegeria meonggei]|uniref:Glyoxalase/Bleomycin resistance protein/Dioxygenase superfamily protein n=1 Tax=Ruegeria meonggei TaxID=1446476 RepID=A0A1X6ZH94_9RHOB|nr:VOC family protein [Ruegeria meonggei]SLN51025.1 Glyoxalase/Bleomycin resistance protein/Dioxygenase superfamily protein [Ruegeria meonggei]